MQPFLTIICLICWLIAAPMANAEPIQITMRSISAEGVGDVIGSVTAKDSDQGLVIFPDLVNLTTGDHGFHLHSNPSCEAALNSEGESVAGLAAGGHWDPDNSGTHLGPFGSGHRGDLSKLIVDADESTKTSVVAPRLITSDLKGHALIVHAGGDTYSDTPALGGGGARVACGVVN
jgi:Cu-Zn family superoxide dismutase